jgi:nucleotide-binding universal stress UspA family protein
MLETTRAARPRGVLPAPRCKEDGGALRVASRSGSELGAILSECHALHAAIARCVELEHVMATLRERLAARMPEASVEVRLEAEPAERDLTASAVSELLIVRARPRALGASAATFFGTADCNVLVARRPYANGPIVVGCDLSVGGLEALKAARAVSRDCGARVVVVHALDEVPASGPALGGRAEAASHAIATAGGTEVEICVSSDPSDDCILRAERELGARLIVVGACGSSRQAGAPGNVATGVATGAIGPVLVVRRVGPLH